MNKALVPIDRGVVPTLPLTDFLSVLTIFMWLPAGGPTVILIAVNKAVVHRTMLVQLTACPSAYLGCPGHWASGFVNPCHCCIIAPVFY